MKLSIFAGVLAAGLSCAFSVSVLAQSTANDEGITPFTRFEKDGAIGAPGARGPGSGPAFGSEGSGQRRFRGGGKGKRNGAGARHFGGGGAGFRQIRQMLSPDQRQNFQSVVQEHRQRMQPLSQELKALRQEAQSNPQGFDPGKKERMKQLRQQLMADRQGVRSQLMNLLTPEQKAKLGNFKTGPSM